MKNDWGRTGLGQERLEIRSYNADKAIYKITEGNLVSSISASLSRSNSFR